MPLRYCGASSDGHSRLVTLSLLMLLLLTTNGHAQNSQDTLLPLEPQQPVERTLAPGETHAYKMTVEAGQYFEFVLEQRGIDVGLVLFGPDGQSLMEANNAPGKTGVEAFSWVAQARGVYRLEIRALTKGTVAGGYLMGIRVMRAATPKEAKAFPIGQLLAESTRLRAQANNDGYRQSIKKLEEALRLADEIDDAAVKALIFFNMGFTDRFLGEKQKALDEFKRALELYTALSDTRGQSITLNHIGLIYLDLNEPQKALENLTRALELLRQVGNRADEAFMHDNLASIYLLMAKRKEAEAELRESLRLWHELGEQRSELLMLGKLADFWKTEESGEKSLAYYEQALLLARAMKDREMEAVTLGSIGDIYNLRGEKLKALDYIMQGQKILHEINATLGEAVALINISLLYRSLGEEKKAMDYLDMALPLLKRGGDPQIETRFLMLIGYAKLQQGSKQEAIDAFTEADKRMQQMGNLLGHATALSFLAMCYEALDQRQKAIEYHYLAFDIYMRLNDRAGAVNVMAAVAYDFFMLGDRQKAATIYKEILPLAHQLNQRTQEMAILFWLARIEAWGGNPKEARNLLAKGLEIVETQRVQIESLDLRASYFATAQSYYEDYIFILMLLHQQEPAAGYDREALSVVERARARTLLDVLSEAKANIREGVDPQLLERERSLRQQLNLRAQPQQPGTPGLNQKQPDDNARAIEALTDELKQVEARIRERSPRYAALTQPQPLSVREIQSEIVDQETVLVEYSLNAAESYAWVVTPDSVTVYRLPPREKIEGAARLVYDLLNARNLRDANETQAQRQARIVEMDARYAKAASELSSMVLAPLAKELGEKRLLIVADGALQYIPFAALPDPTERLAPLVIKHEVINLPSASTLAVLRNEVKDRKPAAKTVAVLADPVFESADERVKSRTALASNVKAQRAGGRRELPLEVERAAEESGLRGLEIPRLPGTRAEAEQILALVPPGESMRAFDFAASRTTATGADLSQYRFIHFATHGFLDSLHPELSGIVLSLVDERGQPQDGFLRAHEVFNLKLACDLVVLSACQTGLGKEVKGEGLVGLTRGFMYAGAPRVVVSLWSVSDAATAELMTRFYRSMLKDKQRPAAALRAAQVSLMREQRWTSPYYWAAFTLQGEWR